MKLLGDDLVEAGLTLDAFTRSYKRIRDLSPSAAHILQQNLSADLSREKGLSAAEQKFLTAYLDLIESRRVAR